MEPVIIIAFILSVLLATGWLVTLTNRVGALEDEARDRAKRQLKVDEAMRQLLAEKGDKLKRFTGPDCWKELDAWNQRRRKTRPLTSSRIALANWRRNE